MKLVDYLRSLIDTPPEADALASLTWSVDNGEVTITGYSRGGPAILTIPSKIDGLPVVAISETAFSHCKNLTDLTVPDSVSLIGGDAFMGCSNLNRIMIGKSIAAIDFSWFSRCENSYSIDVPEDHPTLLIQDGVLFDKAQTTLIRHFHNREASTYKIPEGITTIGQSAFAEYENLTSITIPQSLVRIEGDAFWRCSKLTKISLPQGLSHIGVGAFRQCSSFTEFTIPDSVTEIGGYAFAWCSNLKEIIIPDKVTSIGESSFYHCESLTQITIGESVSEIGSGIFRRCPVLLRVTIPDSVTALGDRAFCENLTHLSLGKGIRPSSIGGLFYNCPKLSQLEVSPENQELCAQDGALFNKEQTTLILYPPDKPGSTYAIPSSVTEIGAHAFYSSRNLVSLFIPDTVKAIKNGGAFTKSRKLARLSIPEITTPLDCHNFAGCSNLAEITIPREACPQGFTRIGFHGAKLIYSSTTTRELQSKDGVFFDHPYEKELKTNQPRTYTVPQGITEIPNGLFAGNKNLARIVIPEGITSIGSLAFSECYNLTEISLPESLVKMGERVFSHCESLIKIIIPNGVRGIPEAAFYHCKKLTHVTLGDKTSFIGDYAFSDCTNLKQIIFPEALTCPETFTWIGEAAFKECASLTKISFPEGDLSIREAAFESCTNLRSISFPKDIDSIDRYAFKKCTNLTRVSLHCIDRISNRAFEDCPILSHIEVDSENLHFKSRDGVLFEYRDDGDIKDEFTKLFLYPPAKRDSTYTIPRDVDSIADSAFVNCIYLKCLSIPRTVNNLESITFGDCHSLTYLSLPEGISHYHFGVGGACDNLTNLTLDGPPLQFAHYDKNTPISLKSVSVWPEYADLYGGEGACWRRLTVTLRKRGPRIISLETNGDTTTAILLGEPKSNYVISKSDISSIVSTTPVSLVTDVSGKVVFNVNTEDESDDYLIEKIASSRRDKDIE